MLAQRNGLHYYEPLTILSIIVGALNDNTERHANIRKAAQEILVLKDLIIAGPKNA